MANQHKQLKPHLLKKQLFANSKQEKQEAHTHQFHSSMANNQNNNIGGVVGQDLTARSGNLRVN